MYAPPGGTEFALARLSRRAARFMQGNFIFEVPPHPIRQEGQVGGGPIFFSFQAYNFLVRVFKVLPKCAVLLPSRLDVRLRSVPLQIDPVEEEAVSDLVVQCAQPHKQAH